LTLSSRRMPASPCRLFVYLAREAPLGVVLRRGPSAWAQLSVWHTDTDTFTHGQWFKGRVYERRCDLSPDGSVFVYFARKTEGRTVANQRRDSWMALSRPPWFTALALWFVGGTYCTGGFFFDRRSLWLGGITAPPVQGQLAPWLSLTTSAPRYIDRTPNWTERTVYINRLLRGGWEISQNATTETWERRHPRRPHTLVMAQTALDYRAFGGPYGTEYAVRGEPQGETMPLGRATWADWDQQGRLVIAQHGRLLHWQPPDTLREIADFNRHIPDPAPAPAWARTWHERPPRASRVRPVPGDALTGFC
jgi:hypothetical protein